MKAKDIIPTLSYRDAKKAIDWLCNAFGFEKHAIHEDDDGLVQHAELTLGNVMIMVSSTRRGSPFEKVTKHPFETDKMVTQSPYIILEEADIEKHYENAKAHDAQIYYELQEEDYGGRNYSCFDPEGHLWHFGTYDPWKK